MKSGVTFDIKRLKEGKKITDAPATTPTAPELDEFFSGNKNYMPVSLLFS